MSSRNNPFSNKEALPKNFCEKRVNPFAKICSDKENVSNNTPPYFGSKISNKYEPKVIYPAVAQPMNFKINHPPPRQIVEANPPPPQPEKSWKRLIAEVMDYFLS